MAKKKDDGEAPFDIDKATDSVIKELNKEYGGIAKSGAEHADRPRHVASISPSFDMATGGIPEGSWNIIVGPKKAGKSLTALQLCAEWQKPENGSRRIFYQDVECRIEQRDLKGIRGLNLQPPHFNFIRSEKGRPLTSTDHYTIGEKIIKTVPGAVLVQDSVSAMCSPSTMEKGINESGDRASGYKMASQFCNILESVVPANGSIIIAICHEYANTSGYGPGRKHKIPTAYEYQATTKLVVKSSERWRDGSETGPQIGLIPKFFVETSALGPPGGEFDCYLRFGVGIDKVFELIQLGTELGVIEQAASWLTLPFIEKAGKPLMLQGAQKLYKALEENPEWAKLLGEKIREAIS